MPTSATVALVVYHGVLADEAEMFRFVLSRLPGFRTVAVGSARGQVSGPGGVQTAEATLEEMGNPQVVAVPGGIACYQRTEIADWLRTTSPTWMLASSTGTTLLAAAGLLDEATATTHWLAGPLLERYGAHPSRERVVIDGSIITCSGTSSAFRAALIVAEAYGGPELVAQIRADAAAARAGPGPQQRRNIWKRLSNAVRRENHAPAVRTPLEQALGETDVLDLGEITPPPDRRESPQ